MGVVAEWVVKVKSPALAGKLTVEQQTSFFALAEQKAQAEDKQDLLREIRGNLADLYLAAGNLKQASEHLRVLVAAGTAGEDVARRNGQLLQVYLGLGSVEDACGLLSNHLSTKNLDLTPEGELAKCIEAYLSNPNTVNPAGVLQSLEQIPVSDPQTLQSWRILLTGWTERYAKARKPEDSDRANN
jgi:hypothetical protein